jgi:hypothetical protein
MTTPKTPRLNKDGTLDKRYTSGYTEEEKKEIEAKSFFQRPLNKRDLKLTKEEEAAIFKGLVHKTGLELANEYDFGRVFDTDGAKRLAVHNIVKKIKKAPDLYGISREVVELVEEALNDRRIVHNPMQVFVKEREMLEFKDKLEVIRDQAADILSKKLEKLSGKKNMDDVKIKEIADVMSMAIDKFRLVKGESTDNIVHFSKLDMKDISPDQALQLILRAREAVIDSKK